MENNIEIKAVQSTELPVHTWPEAQSVELQHEPLTQAPAQHFWPAPHWASEAHRPQKPLGLQVAPPGQSAVVQQFPGRHEPLQHRSPEAQSVLFTQLEQALF